MHVAAAYADATIAGVDGSFAFEPRTLLAMQVAMLFSVVGRASEVGYSDDTQAYNAYKEASIARFLEHMRGKLSSVPEHVVVETATALREMHCGAPSAIKRVLEVSHNLDLLRCSGGSDMVTKIGAIAADVGNDKALSLATFAENAILRTGDRLLHSPSGGGTRSAYHRETFHLCSRSAKDAWDMASSSAAAPAMSLTTTPPVAGEATLGGQPSRFLTSYYKVMHQAQVAQWRAISWAVAANVTAQREQIIENLSTLLTEFCLTKPGTNAVRAFGHVYAACNVDGESTIDMAVRMWTLGPTTHLGNLELCSVLNAVLRGDDRHTPEQQRPSPIFRAAVTLVCAIQFHLTASRRTAADQPMHWPRGDSATGDDRSDEAHTAFRGAGIPIEHVAFYKALCQQGGGGPAYRVAGLLPSSFSRETALSFMYRAKDGGAPVGVTTAGWRGVLFTIRLHDPSLMVHENGGGCKHVNYIEKTQFSEEREFLFSTYSVFRVLDVNDTNQDIVITLQAAVDNKQELEDLPTTPWC